MAEESAISWTRSTFNPWIGCTKIGPGCDACYADALDEKRMSKTLGGGTSLAPIRHWGPGAPRYRTSVHNWNEPLRWQRKAALEQSSGVLTPKSTWKGAVGHWPVFCSSLADVFDNEVDEAWRRDLWSTVLATPSLSWLLVTKRIGNVRSMVPPAWLDHGFPANVRLLITVVNQEEADRDVPKLLRLPVKNGVSYEPALELVAWGHFLPRALSLDEIPGHALNDGCCAGRSHGLEWIIVGGESAQGGVEPRPFSLDWALSTIYQCRAADVPVFVKQLGARPLDSAGAPIEGLGDAGSNPAGWPLELRVQEFPLG